MIEKGSIETVKRLVLAGTVLGGSVACSGTGSEQREALKCPTTAAEVTHLVGGNPEEWKAVNEGTDAWVLRSKTYQMLTGPFVGRLDNGAVLGNNTSSLGKVLRGKEVLSNFAWYVCPESARPITPTTSQNTSK